MNKNTKKFVVALLSVLMVLSFMPTMAFAETGDVTPKGIEPYNHTYSTTADAKLSKAATCSEFGMNVYLCNIGTQIEDSEGTKVDLTCNAQERKLTTGTHKYNKDRITVAQALQILLEKGQIETLDDLDSFLTKTAGKCYAFVDKCTVCDFYNITLTSVGSADWQGHVAPEKPACAESFTCETCGLPVTRTVARADHNWEHTYNSDDPSRQQVIGWNWEYMGYECAGSGNNNRVELYRNVCKDCDKTVVLKFKRGNPAHTGQLDAPKYTAAQWNALDNTTKGKEQPYLIQYNGDWYEPNDFDTKKDGPSCTDPSAEGYGLLVCPDCGIQVTDSTCRVAAVGHTPTKVTTAATCTEDGRDITYCAVCGKRISNKKNSDKATGHSYKVTVMAEPTIYDSGITVIECEKCHRFMTNRYDNNRGDVEASYNWTSSYNNNPRVRNTKSDGSGDWYFVGFDREFYDDSDASKPRITEDAIKLNPWQALKPHYTAYATMSEATCTLPEIQAMKDTVSGDFYVHVPKTIGKPLGHTKKTFEVKATCGTEGYSYDTCETCKKIYDPKTKKFVDLDPAVDPVAYAYNKVAPIVSAGTPCQFEWGDLDENTEAMICTKCGAVKEGTQTPKTEEKKAKEAAEAAKPVIEQAANITSDTATYKASSIEAIKAAKANLDTAIYAGSADQIKKATAELQAAIAAAQEKDANTMTAKGKTVKANSKKKTTFSKAKAFKISGAKGTVTFKKKSGNKKVTVSKAGKVTVKKGLKKGKTYKIKVTVKAAGNGDYKAKSQVVTLKVKVK